MVVPTASVTRVMSGSSTPEPEKNCSNLGTTKVSMMRIITTDRVTRTAG